MFPTRILADQYQGSLEKDNVISNHQKPDKGYNMTATLPKFQQRFGVENVVLVEENVRGNLAKAARDAHCDLLYVLKGGTKRNMPSWPAEDPKRYGIKSAVHAVFSNEPHGDIYAGISSRIGTKIVVPHMIEPASQTVAKSAGDFRSELGINKTSYVLCRHGGTLTFNIDFVRDLVPKLAAQHENLHFLFLNTDANSMQGPHIHHLPMMVDDISKERFFNTCDGMLHARRNGETFGLTVAEFSVRNKPVITWRGDSTDRYDIAHLDILGDKALVYSDSQDLEHLVTKLVTGGIDLNADYNAYRGFYPKPIMETFRTAFYDGNGIKLPAQCNQKHAKHKKKHAHR
jgi:hypothetical protein